MANEMIDRRKNVTDRRQDPPICAQPCIPITEELNKRDKFFKEDMKLKDKKIHDKLDGIFTCLGTKVPSKIFWRLGGGIAFVIFVLIGGTLWEMKSELNSIGSDVRVMSVTVKYNAKTLETHSIEGKRQYEQLERRVDKIERGETYFNFYNKGRLHEKHESKPYNYRGDEK